MRIFKISLIFALCVSMMGPMPQVYALPPALRADRPGGDLPQPGARVALSPAFNPPVLKGLKVHPDNPFRFDFILDEGDETSSNLKQESAKLIKYFLASLTIPEKDLWVNLSPYEKNRIIPQSFGLTEMGRDLLAQDYMLKQITASLIYPEDELGKKFWKRVYEEAAKKFGTTNIPVNTFNKVWIVPEKAIVYENAKAGTAYVVESRLKVMLEEDYVALNKNSPPPSLPRQGGGMQVNSPPLVVSRLPSNAGLQVKAPQGTNQTHSMTSQIVRELIIPALTKEVNEGQNFAQLRQIYNSLILATWYKKKIKGSILAQVYADKNKVSGLQPIRGHVPEPIRGHVPEASAKAEDRYVSPETIYQRYLQAFKKGVYNYIKEEQAPLTQQVIPRKYFSGGFSAKGFSNMAMSTTVRPEALPQDSNRAMRVTVDLAMSPVEEKTGKTGDSAQLPSMGGIVLTRVDIMLEVWKVLGMNVTLEQVLGWLDMIGTGEAVKYDMPPPANASKVFINTRLAIDVFQKTGSEYFAGTVMDIAYALNERKGKRDAELKRIKKYVTQQYRALGLDKRANIHMPITAPKRDNSHGRQTKMNTTNDRSKNLDYPILKFMEHKKGSEPVVIVDLGLGYPPMTTTRTAKLVGKNAQVIGVDINMPDFVTEFSLGYQGDKYIVFWELNSSDEYVVAYAMREGDPDGGILQYTPLEGDEARYIAWKAGNIRIKLMSKINEQEFKKMILLQKKYDLFLTGIGLDRLGVSINDFQRLFKFYEESDVTEGSNRLKFEPMKKLTKKYPNLQLRKGDFRLSSVQEAVDIIRVGNVFQYYNAQEIREAISMLGKKLKTGGILVVATNDDIYLLFEKVEDKIVPRTVSINVNGAIPAFLIDKFPQYRKLFIEIGGVLSDVYEETGKIYGYATRSSPKAIQSAMKMISQDFQGRGYAVSADEQNYLHINLETGDSAQIGQTADGAMNSDNGHAPMGIIYDGQVYDKTAAGLQGTIYRSWRTGKAIKVYNKIPEHTGRHLRELVRLNQILRQEKSESVVEMEGVVPISAPADFPQQGILMKWEDGRVLGDLLNSLGGDLKLSQRLSAQADGLLDWIDSKTGGLADRRMGVGGKEDYRNFIVRGGVMIDVDPIDIKKLISKEAGDRAQIGQTADQAMSIKTLNGNEKGVKAYIKKAANYYFAPKSFETSKLYKSLGVRRFQKIYDKAIGNIRPVMWEGESRGRSFNRYKLGNNKEGFMRRLRIARNIETFHLVWSGGMLLASGFYLLKGDYYMAGWWMACNVMGNGYSIMSQRFLRERILEILKRYDQENILLEGKPKGASVVGKDETGDSAQIGQTADQAMRAKDVGGIDLTADKMNVDVKVGGNGQEGIEFNMDPAMLERLQNAPGFVPVIINIQPLTDLPGFLGFKDQPQIQSINHVVEY